MVVFALVFGLFRRMAPCFTLSSTYVITHDAFDIKISITLITRIMLFVSHLRGISAFLQIQYLSRYAMTTSEHQMKIAIRLSFFNLWLTSWTWVDVKTTSLSTVIINMVEQITSAWVNTRCQSILVVSKSSTKLSITSTTNPPVSVDKRTHVRNLAVCGVFFVLIITTIDIMFQNTRMADDTLLAINISVKL